MTKIVYNACFGGFGLSDEAVLRYAEIKGITLYVVKEKFFTQFYLCPPEEYERLYAEDSRKLFSSDRYEKSNAKYFSPTEIPRDDPVLAQVVKELGDKANSRYSKLKIMELKPGTLYRIEEYDGRESVMTNGTYEWSVA